VCSDFAPLSSRLTISVVMSRTEARAASNSARLLALWLPGVELHVRGGADDPRQPAALAARPGSALLFPGGERAQPLPRDVSHLIVPDGTWAQARRIERRWFAPLGLPRVELAGPWPSVYGLRRRREGLCTFEAVAVALGALDDRALGAALLARFAEWALRAGRLKAGGGAVVLPEPAPEHPAAGLLRALPVGSADARSALAAAELRGGAPAPRADDEAAQTTHDEQRGQHAQAPRE
jgi:DTW domain-containing protein YfiP